MSSYPVLTVTTFLPLVGAAVILLVVDAREGILPQDDHIARMLRRAHGQVVVVANKADNPRVEAGAGEFHALGFQSVIPVSAEPALLLDMLENLKCLRIRRVERGRRSF